MLTLTLTLTLALALALAHARGVLILRPRGVDGLRGVVGPGPVGNFTRRKFRIIFCMFCGFSDFPKSSANLRKSPQNSAKLPRRTRPTNSKIRA